MGDGAPYKPKVKGERARAGVRGVRSTADAGDHDVGRGKGSCFGRGNVREVSARAWSRDPTPPPTPVIRYEDSSGACSQWIAEAGQHGETRQASVPEGPLEETIGKPYAGNPHVRFDRGPQETELKRHRV